MSIISVDQIKDVAGGNTSQINDMTPTSDSLRGFRNRLINGNFKIWQRGTSFTATSTALYTADRWNCAASGANLSVVRDGTIPNQNLAVTSNASSTYFWIGQRVEAANTYDLVGKRVSLSGRLYRSGTAIPLRVRLYYANTVDDFSSVTEIEQFNTTLTADGFFNFSYATTNVLPAEASNGLLFRLDFTSGVTSGSFALIDCQLEAGSVATPFERRPYGTELQLCLRYYEQSDGNLDFGAVGTSNAAITGSIPYIVQKRATPTFVFTDIVGNANRVTLEGTNNVTISGGGIGTTGNRYAQARAAITGAGNGSYVRWRYTADAEL
jgi:hypothetical protein